MIVAWTGHRPDLFRDPDAAHAAVDTAAHQLAAEGAKQFLVGGQRGVDTWAALAAVTLAVPFVVILPFNVGEFTRDWTPDDRAVLDEQVLAHAQGTRIAGGYTERNRELATQAELLVAVWGRVPGGGTAETIELARKAGTPIREIVLEPSADANSTAGRGR
jgi:hypothetical protein